MLGGFLAKRFLAPDRTVETSLGPTTESQGADSELLFVFIATSTCAGINDPALPPALRKVRNYLSEQAARDGQRFVTLGISLDTDTRIGQQLLARFGSFDELLLGRGWLNTGAIKYIWEDIRGLPAVPQIVVTTRSVVRGRTVEVSGEQSVLRKVGATQIVNWSEAITN